MKDFSFQILKELLELFVKLVEASAWPVVVCCIARNYRAEVGSILNRLEKAKLGGTELLLSKEQAEETVTKASEQAINLISGDITGSIISSRSDANQETDRPVTVLTGDVDGDGKDELIVSSNEGSYWCRVRVFKPVLQMSNNSEIETSFKLIGEISPVNFLEDVRDIDSDTFAEIIVNEDDRDSDQPHVAGLREKVVYKLIDNRLSEVSRKKLPRLNTQAEMNEFTERDFREIEIQMNQIFQKIISSLETEVELKQSMKKAQEAWLKYREVQAKANSEIYKEGSIYPLVYYTNMSKLTISRINELDKIIHRQEGSFA